MAFDIAPYGEAIAQGSKLLNGILQRVLPEKVSEETALRLNQELSLALLHGELEPMLAQIRVNEKEAAHDSIFVAGWRPFIGWVCGTALAYHFIAIPSMTYAITLYKWQVPPLPVFDMGTLMTVLMGMLGLGAMRSYEKIKGETTTATKVGA